jgi:hypothetical protein
MTIQATDRYCPICGKDVPEPSFKRFGEWVCSEAHAEEYVKEVRAEKVRTVGPELRPEDRPTRRGCCG